MDRPLTCANGGAAHTFHSSVHRCTLSGMDYPNQRRVEVRAIAELGLVELGKATRGVARMHQSVSDGVFGGLARTPLSAWTEPSRVLHDSIAGSTYHSVASTMDTLGRAAGSVVDGRGRPPSHTHRGAAALGVLNGLIGDELSRKRSVLAPTMSIRVDGLPVDLTSADITAAFESPSEHVVLFLHGLMETEFAWAKKDHATYGERLERDLGATEILIRYNSGRHISDNGAELSRLLAELSALWPVPIRTVTLVGHSMGGLVIRSACHAAADTHAPWLPALRHTVCLGTPHLGAPLARGVHVATTALRAAPVTRPIGDFLRRRSGGVRDLFHGALTEDDWTGRDPDILRQAAVADIPLVPHARHLYVTASVTRDPRHPVGRIVGDGLVLAGSGRGAGRARRIGYLDDDGMHIGGTHHFTLLNNDTIYDWLLGQLTERRALPPARTPDPLYGMTS